jgi:hypothetical protein
MANLPLRKLGGVGVITDASPYDLPPNAFSSANNVVFAEGRIQRAPVFKALFPPILSAATYTETTGTYVADPNTYEAATGGSPSNSRFIDCYTNPASGEVVLVCDNDGTVRTYPAGELAIVTPTSTVLLPTAASTNTGTGVLGTVTAPNPLPNDDSYTVDFSVTTTPAATTYTVTTEPATTYPYAAGSALPLGTGESVVISGAPANGDSFTVAPVITGMQVTPFASNVGKAVASAVTAPNPLPNGNFYQVNFATTGTLTALTSQVGTKNTGTGSVGTITVPNPLPNAYQYALVFEVVGGVTYYRITTFTGTGNSSGGLVAYTAGATIALGTGESVVINGAPANGDTFTISPVATQYTVTTVTTLGSSTSVAETYTSGGTITLGTGVTLTISGVAAVNDYFTITPVATLVATASTTNTGTGVLGAVTAPNPLPNVDSYEIVFTVDGITTYAVNSTTYKSAYTSGSAIPLAAGISLVITGAPKQGDAFTLAPNEGAVTNDNPWTHAQVEGISYLARAGMIPYVRNILTDAAYSLIGGDWVQTDTAAIVRGYQDFTLMLNINRNGTPLPTMVKWNNPPVYSSAVSDIFWNPTNPNYISGENTLGEMRDPIRDGATLGANFVIYSQNQMWMMSYVGGEDVFYFQRIPYEGGIINANCVVEVNSQHYVFGDNDIYVHNGLQYQSLAQGRVRRRIFNTIDRSKQNSCFVSHDPVAKLIHFCYATLQDEANFAGSNFCNQSATYNYQDDTWQFMDLPNIVGGTEANASLVQDTFGDASNSYGLYNAPYTSFSGGGTPRISVMLGVSDPNLGLTASQVYAVDLPSIGIVNLPAEPETLKTAYVERTGLSLDIQGIPLRAYKLVQSAVPMAEFDDTDSTFTVQFGSSDLPEQTPTYRSSVTYDPNTDYKIDMMVAGRYLAFKFSTSSISNFNISGMDCEIKAMGRR